MLTVHHLNNSRSQRVLWLLEELGLPYEIKHYQRDAKTMLAPVSARVAGPSVITGDLPSGWIAFSSGGASMVFASRW